MGTHRDLVNNFLEASRGFASLAAFAVWASAQAAAAQGPAPARFSSELPILEIALPDTLIPDDPKAVTRMRLVNNGPGALNAPGGTTEDYVGAVAIEKRGSSSLRLFPKVGYGLELRGADGADTSAALLGMPAEEDWVLHGPYSDKSLIRNAFVYELARGLPGYAPRSRFVELVLDGEYWGVYLLTESIKRDGDRVDLPKLQPADTTGVALTGGYILKIDNITGEDSSIVSGFDLPATGRPGKARTPVLFHYPKPRNINAPQRRYIESWMTEFESRLASDDYEHPTRGYAPLIDEESFVDYFLMTELSRNVDAYFVSAYFYKDRDDEGGRLHMGPLWDYNLALGNASWDNAVFPVGWSFFFTEEAGARSNQPFWWWRLWNAEGFKRSIVERWGELRQPGAPLSQSRVLTLYDSLATRVGGEVAERNFARWPVLGQYTWPNVRAAASHADEVAHVRNYIIERLAWMDEQLGFVSAPRDVAPRDLALSPNPYRPGADLRLRGLLPDERIRELVIFDQTGRIVDVAADPDLGSLTTPPRPGIYYYRFQFADGRYFQTSAVGID